ncbi:hypothetical protein TorRG33x02_280400, partial [Trema orientale]
TTRSPQSRGNQPYKLPNHRKENKRTMRCSQEKSFYLFSFLPFFWVLLDNPKTWATDLSRTIGMKKYNMFPGIILAFKMESCLQNPVKYPSNVQPADHQDKLHKIRLTS